MYPPVAFCRLMYTLSIACSNSSCYGDLKFITQEIKDCIMFMYLGSLFFLFAGIYLYEIFPKDFGTKRHPLFFLDFFKKEEKAQEEGDSGKGHSINIYEED